MGHGNVVHFTIINVLDYEYDVGPLCSPIKEPCYLRASFES